MIQKIGLWQRLRRTPYQSLAAVMIMTLTFFVMGLFIILATFSSSILSYFESKPQVTAFFTDKKDANSIKNLEAQLKATGKVSSAKYVSKEEALNIYRQSNKNDPLLLEMVTADILPASLEVQATDPQYLSDINAILKKEPEVEEVVFQKDIIDALLSWTQTIRSVGFIVVFVLILVSLSILMTIIGMKIALKKEEIEILTLVGATAGYIKHPFLKEGILYGIIGAVLSWSIIYLLILYFSPFLASFLKGIPQLRLTTLNESTVLIWPVSVSFMFIVLIIEVVISIIVGMLGSLLALKRYLRF